MATIRIIIILLLALAAGQARAQAVLDGTVERIDLWPYVRVLQEPSGMLELQHVLSSPEKFAAFIQSESHKWAKVVKDAGVKVDA